MKEVQLIKIDSARALINEAQDYYHISHCEHLDGSKMIKNSDMEFLAHSEVEVENIPIQRIHEHGREHYIAVPNKVWEYLYLLTNPVTAESQESKIRGLKGRVEVLGYALRVNKALYDELKGIVESATLWERIKWVFTGIEV